MAYTGRTIIKTPYEIIDETNIVEILSDATSTFESNTSDIDYLFKYFKGDQPILNRTKVYHDEINNKIVENHANEIVAFKVGYLLWKPIQYVSRKEGTKETAMELLSDCMYAENKEDNDKAIAKDQSICGTAYRLALPNKEFDEEIGESPFNIFRIDPQKAFVVYSDTYTSKPVLGVFVDTIINDKGEEVERYQAYTDKEYFVIVNDEIIEKQSHTYGMIPLIEYPLNEERMGDFERVIDLLDAINLVQSNRLDGVEQFIQALLVFKNVDIDNDSFTKLKELGAIKIKDNGELQANVSYLTQELNQTQVQALKNDMYNVVLKIVGMPSQGDGTQNIDANNGAVIIQNGWQGADARASETESSFKASEKQFLKLILNISKTLTANKIDLKIGDIDIVFTRRNYENIYQKAQVLDLLLKNEKVAPRLAFSVCGLFTDAEEAYTESSKYFEQLKSEESKLKNGGNEDESQTE